MLCPHWKYLADNHYTWETLTLNYSMSKKNVNLCDTRGSYDNNYEDDCLLDYDTK